MYLRPMPEALVYKEESGFFINFESRIYLDSKWGLEEFQYSKDLQEEIKNLLGLNLAIKKSFTKDFSKNSIRLIKDSDIQENYEEEQYKIEVFEDSVEIKAAYSKGLFYGIKTFLQIVKNDKNNISAIKIEDKPHFKNRGYYLDVTRGKVPTLKTLKNLVDKISSYKINQFQLYIEHSFAYEGFSEIWFDKDPLTAEEVLELDCYCKSKNVELVPSIASFGHLYEILRSESFGELSEFDDSSEFSFFDRQAHHTLDVSNPRSIELVRAMIEDYLPLFSSNKFNIGCDETFDLGKGKSKNLLASKGSGKLYVDFLNEIIKIVRSYNKEVLFWGDVIIHYPELISEIDENSICLNWNYWHLAEEKDTELIYNSGRKQYLCPGVASWNQFMNLMDRGYENIRRMTSYAVKYSAEGMLNTDWGDYGHINILENSMTLMIYGAASSWNPKELGKENDFKAISFLEYGEENFVSLLAELATCETITWYEVVKWKEKFSSDIKEDIINEFKNFDSEKIKEDYYKALELRDKIYNYTEKLENKELIKSFLISSEGIALINDFSLYMLGDVLEDEKITGVNEKKKLAEKIELWFYSYRELWREGNKESELIRNTEIIKYICKYLRKTC